MADLAWTTDVRLASGGDREAFTRLIRGMQNEMYRMARSLLQHDEDCADAIQEAILNAYRGMPRLREPAYFRTWLFRILIRECQQIHRRRRRTLLTDQMPDHVVMMTQKDLDMQDAVERLGEPLKVIVKLHYFADLPLADIAEMLNVSEGTVKSRLHRARKLLAAKLTGPGKGEIGYEFL